MSDVSFDFTKSEGVLKATQVIADASYNQSIPVPNLVGCTRAVNAAIRLAELQVRYQMLVVKHSDAAVKPIALLE